MLELETKEVPVDYDHIAPDCSEIRLLPEMRGGGLAHCTLPPKLVSKPVYHKTVEEIWFFLEGKGQVWRKLDKQESVVDVKQGVSLTIPTGSWFQFRNTEDIPLKFLIVTMPVWPGPDEAVPLKSGEWEFNEKC